MTGTEQGKNVTQVSEYIIINYFPQSASEQNYGWSVMFDVCVIQDNVAMYTAVLNIDEFRSMTLVSVESLATTTQHNPKQIHFCQNSMKVRMNEANFIKYIGRGAGWGVRESGWKHE